MLVFTDFRLLLDVVLKLCIVVTTEKPSEDSLLDLLVVLLLEEFVMEKLHGAHDEKLAFLLTRIESSDRPVGGETDGTTGQNGHRWLVHVQSGSIWVDKLKSTVFVPLDQIVLVDCVALGILASLLVGLLGLSLGYADQILVEDSIADEALLGMQILVEVLPNDRVVVDADAYLLEESIDVRVQSRLTSLLHDDERIASILNVVPDVLKLMASERLPRSSKQQQLLALERLLTYGLLIHSALYTHKAIATVSNHSDSRNILI